MVPRFLEILRVLKEIDFDASKEINTVGEALDFLNTIKELLNNI